MTFFILFGLTYDRNGRRMERTIKCCNEYESNVHLNVSFFVGVFKPMLEMRNERAEVENGKEVVFTDN